MHTDRILSLPVAVSLLSLIVAALSLVVSAFNYLNARAVREDAQLVAHERQTLHLTGKPKLGNLELSPSNSSFSLGAVYVIFPADSKIPREYQLPGDHSIHLANYQSVLQARSTAIDTFRSKLGKGTIEYIPIIVSAEYFFEGKHLTSHALYQLYYLNSKETPKSTIEPVSLKYCRELAEEKMPIDFLIDPRFLTTFGYPDKPSVSVMSNCHAESLTYFSIQKGEVMITANPEYVSQPQISSSSSPDAQVHP